MTSTDDKIRVPDMSTINSRKEKRAWLGPLLFGIFIALLFLTLILFLFRPMQAKKSAINSLDPLALQSANLSALEEEIATLRNALKMEPCAMPPLAGTSIPAVPNASEKRTDAVGSLVNKLENATVIVLVESTEGLGNGSGFFVAPNMVLTNRHVIDSLVGSADKVFVSNKALGGLVPAKIVRATRPDELRDYALLSVSPPPGSGHSVLDFSESFKKTDRVSAWGYPVLLTKTDPQLTALMNGDAKAVPESVYSEGVISVVQDFHGLSLINHTAEVSPGNSGGPLVNEEGQVVGINTMIRVDEESNRQVNVALGSNDLISFIAGSVAVDE